MKRSSMIFFMTYSKSKITVFFLLKGLEKVIHYQQVRIWKEENGISDEQLDALVELYKTEKVDAVMTDG
jgi:hypothetical protein